MLVGILGIVAFELRKFEQERSEPLRRFITPVQHRHQQDPCERLFVVGQVGQMNQQRTNHGLVFRCEGNGEEIGVVKQINRYLLSVRVFREPLWLIGRVISELSRKTADWRRDRLKTRQ